METAVAPPPLTYDEVVDRYGIEILKSPGDWALKDGGLATTKAGDLMLNNPVYSALHRLVQSWRFTAPALTVLFDLLHDTRRNSEADWAELNALRPLSGAFSFNEEQLDRYHELNDRVAAFDLTSEAYAGSVVLVLSGLLLAFKDDMDASREDWEAAGPLIGGCSVGAVVAASANNFRHYDEWIKTRPPTQQQAVSIRVLTSAFGKPIADVAAGRFSLNVTPETVDLLSQGEFETLSTQLFDFANDLAKRTMESILVTGNSQ